MSHIDTGKSGEAFAVEYLQSQGYSIRETNYRCKIGEIDIIAEESDELVFVEVKTRQSDDQGSPLEAVTAKKQQAIIKIAQWYLTENGIEDTNVRFDVLGLLQEGATYEPELVKEAFEAF